MTDTEAFAELRTHLQANSTAREAKLKAKIKELEARLEKATNLKTSVTVSANIQARKKLAFVLTKTLAPISESHKNIYDKAIAHIQAFEGQIKND